MQKLSLLKESLLFYAGALLINQLVAVVGFTTSYVSQATYGEWSQEIGAAPRKFMSWFGRRGVGYLQLSLNVM